MAETLAIIICVGLFIAADLLLLSGSLWLFKQWRNPVWWPLIAIATVMIVGIALLGGAVVYGFLVTPWVFTW